MSLPLLRRARWRLVLLAGATVILLPACGDDPAEQDTQVIRPARTTVVSTEPALIQRTYPAVVLPAQQVELAFKVSGRILELPVRAATMVDKGEAIAQLDQREFAAAVARLESQLAQANAQLAAMTAGARSEDVASAEAKVNAARAQLATQQSQVNRLQQLIERGSVARVELEREQAKLKSDAANLDVAQQELIKAQVGARSEEVDAQEAAIRDLETQLSEAKTDLEETTLRAPFDGIISARLVDNFANVQANEIVAVLQKIDTIDFQYDVPGIDVAKFAEIDPPPTAKARLDVAPEQEFDAQLVEFSTQADATTQTFQARASIRNPDGITVLPGMTGSIIATAEQQAQLTLTIPEAALAAEPDGSSYVWVVDLQDNSVSKRAVTPGNIAGGDVSISDGLEDGDVIVTAGVSFLREGMSIRPISEGVE